MRLNIIYIQTYTNVIIYIIREKGNWKRNKINKQEKPVRLRHEIWLLLDLRNNLSHIYKTMFPLSSLFYVQNASIYLPAIYKSKFLLCPLSSMIQSTHNQPIRNVQT